LASWPAERRRSSRQSFPRGSWRGLRACLGTWTPASHVWDGWTCTSDAVGAVRDVDGLRDLVAAVLRIGVVHQQVEHRASPRGVLLPEHLGVSEVLGGVVPGRQLPGLGGLGGLRQTISGSVVARGKAQRPGQPENRLFTGATRPRTDERDPAPRPRRRLSLSRRAAGLTAQPKGCCLMAAACPPCGSRWTGPTCRLMTTAGGVRVSKFGLDNRAHPWGGCRQ
jgi:hypothetical protein